MHELVALIFHRFCTVACFVPTRLKTTTICIRHSASRRLCRDKIWYGQKQERRRGGVGEEENAEGEEEKGRTKFNDSYSHDFAYSTFGFNTYK